MDDLICNLASIHYSLESITLSCELGVPCADFKRYSERRTNNVCVHALGKQ